jgi:O-antigen/teichoic acid export membrane protein
MLKTISGTFASKFGLALLNFGTIILSARLLGAAGRGEISFFVTNMVLILLFTNIVGGPSLVYLTPRYNFFKFLIPVYAWTLFITLLFCLLFLQYHQVSTSDFYFLFLATLFNSWKSSNMMILLGKEKMAAFNWLALVHSVFLIGLFLLFYYPFHQISVESFYWGVLLSNVIVWLWSFLLLFKLNETIAFTFDNMVCRQLIALGWMAQMANIIQFANYRISYYYLMNSPSQGASELGKYSIAVSIAESVWIIGQSLATVQFSKLSNVDDAKERKKISLRLFKLNFTLNLIAVFVLLCIPASLYLWMFGEGFDMVSQYIQWMAIGIFSLGVSTSISSYFGGRGMYKPAIYSSLWGVFFTVLICHFFIPTWGVQAAAWATTISYTALCIYFLIVFLNAEQVSLSKLLPGYGDFNLYRRWLKKVI